MPRKTKAQREAEAAAATATIDPADLAAHEPIPATEEDWNSEPRIIPEVLPHIELEPEPDDDEPNDDDDIEPVVARALGIDPDADYPEDGMLAGAEDGESFDEETAVALPDAEDVYGDTQLNLPADIEFDAWETMGGTLLRFERSNAWWLGDWANRGEALFGEEYSQALDAESFAKDLHTIQNYKWVADAIPAERRRAELHWTHHEIVASMDPDDQDRWLQRAIDEDLSTRDLRKAIKDSQAIEVEHRPADDDDGDEEPDELELVYGELYSAVQLAGKLAEECGYPVGVRQEDDSPGYETLYIDLPESGQVSWQVPTGDMIGSWSDYGPAWDGHSSDERAERIRAFVDYGPLAAEEDSHAIDPDDDLDDLDEDGDEEPITREPVTEAIAIGDDHTQAGEDIDDDEIPFD